MDFQIMELPAGKKLFFLSDFHLGSPDYESSRKRELLLVKFFLEKADEAHAVFLVGDLFDFWFEYRHVVPKGYIRFFGALAALADAGIELHFFAGNHDMWMKDYLTREINLQVHMNAHCFEANGKKFYVAHGDGLGPGDHKYKMLKTIFRNPVSQWLFGILPPAIGMGTANYFSDKSRQTGVEEQHFYGIDKERLILHSQEMLRKEHFDYFIYGHRHLPGKYAIADGSEYVNLGDWISFNSYAVFDGHQLSLEYYPL